VLFIVFNKPETTQRVFEQIARAKPRKLYVATDGPRSAEEAETCRRAQEIATNLSWDCELKTLFRDRNVGCQQGPKGAIDWFFGMEESGIILEDDCVPTQSFFRYCDELLVRYRDDERVGAISGISYVKPGTLGDSYYFSRYPLTWGWASWARVWRHYDLELKQWPKLRETDFLSEIGGSSFGFEAYWRKMFDDCYEGKWPSAWDYQWAFSNWAKRYVACVPAVNLVSNIGFGGGGTHHSRYNSVVHGRPTFEMSFPLKHPSSFSRSGKHDNWIDRHVFHTANYALRTFVQERIPFGRSLWGRARDVFRFFAS
jgi:hypothetical protein